MNIIHSNKDFCYICSVPQIVDTIKKIDCKEVGQISLLFVSDPGRIVVFDPVFDFGYVLRQ